MSKIVQFILDLKQTCLPILQLRTLAFEGWIFSKKFCYVDLTFLCLFEYRLEECRTYAVGKGLVQLMFNSERDVVNQALVETTHRLGPLVNGQNRLLTL